MTAIWHRFEDYRTAPPGNEFGDPEGPSGEHLRHRKFYVDRQTPKGVRLREFWGETPPEADQFSSRDTWLVLHASQKKYAYPSEAEAREGFIARKRAQARILRGQLRYAENAILMAEQCVLHAHELRWFDAAKLSA